MKARLGGGLSRTLAGEQQLTREFDTATSQVLMRRDPVCPGECADQVGRVGVQHLGRLAQGEALRCPGVQQLAQLCGESRRHLAGLR
jgi:hypothetical protein